MVWDLRPWRLTLWSQARQAWCFYHWGSTPAPASWGAKPDSDFPPLGPSCPPSKQAERPWARLTFQDVPHFTPLPYCGPSLPG